MVTWQLWLWMPLVTALIGWLTNWLAIRMLFHPRKPLKIGPWTIQGLIPQRQDDIADRIAEIVQHELLGQQFLREQVSQLNLEEHAERAVVRLVRQRIAPQIRKVPMFGGTVEPILVQHLERIATNVILEELSRLQNEILAEAEQQQRIREIIRHKIATFDVETLEGMVLRLASREFRQIEALGAVLGFVVGVGQMVILTWTT